MPEVTHPLALAADHQTAGRDDWLEAVDATLRGSSRDRLTTSLPGGLRVQPLYSRDDAHPESAPPGVPGSPRGSRPDGLVEAGWDIRQRHGLSTVDRTNREILTDLQRGVTSIELLTVGIDDLDTLEAVLAEVMLDIAPIGLCGPGTGVGAARLLLALYERRGVPAAEVRADLGCDPIGRLADHGTAGEPIGSALENVGELAAGVAASYPHVRTVRADGRPYAFAGASATQELAALLATGVAYLRTLEEAGLAPEVALGQVLLVISIDADQFLGIAKIRALRRMWGRVAEAVGVADPPAPTIQAIAGGPELTRRDPWVNMLRTTIGCFAAGVGGADIVTVTPFDAMVGHPDDLGFRTARNTQLILQAEANVHRVIDPAGGSWYVEALTEDLAVEAWRRFQAIEGVGGMVTALREGIIQSTIAGERAERAEAIARRTEPITGVSEFPHVSEEPLDRAPYHPPPGPAAPLECDPLPRFIRAGQFQQLRDAADAAKVRPLVFLANLGPAAVHGARATFATNLFGAGGWAVLPNDGFGSPAEAAASFVASGATVAAICSSDAVYTEQAAATATALVEAGGAARVILAGNPGEHRESYEAAGIGGFIHVGVDAVAVLAELHAVAGLIEQEEGSS